MTAGHSGSPAGVRPPTTGGVADVDAGREGIAQARAAYSGQCGFALVEQHLVTDSSREHVVDLLEPD